MLGDQPTALFLLGDNAYIDWPEIPETQRHCYYRPAAFGVSCQVWPPQPAIYDDHDCKAKDR